MTISETSTPKEVAEAIKDYAKKEGHQPYVDLIEKHLGDNALSKLNNNRLIIKPETYSNAIKAIHNESQSKELKDKLTPNTLKFTESSVNFIKSKETINKIIKENEEIITKPLKPLKEKPSVNFFKSKDKIYEIEKENNKIKRENNKIKRENNKINEKNEEIRKKNNGKTPELKSIEENHQVLKKSVEEINKLQLEQKIKLSTYKINFYLKGNPEIQKLSRQHLNESSKEGFKAFIDKAINVKSLSKPDKDFLKEAAKLTEIEVSKKGISAVLKVKITEARKNLDKKLEKYDKDKDLVNGKGVVSRARAAIRPKAKPIRMV